MAEARSATKPAFRQQARQTFTDARRALLLQEDVYAPYLQKERPFRFGCGALALLILPAAIALGVGVALNLLTLPRVDLLQADLSAIFTQSAFYQSLAGQYPALAVLFNVMYSMTWWTLRLTGAYPYPAGILITPISFILGVLFNWWLFTILLQMVAGWLGGRSRKGALYGPMVFAFAPQLINVLGFIPGLAIPSSLPFIWTLAVTYQIIRATYGFAWGRSVMTIILTLVMNAVLIALAVVFGVLIGVWVAGRMS